MKTGPQDQSHADTRVKRTCTYEGQSWEERVLVTQSFAHAERERHSLQTRLGGPHGSHAPHWTGETADQRGGRSLEPGPGYPQKVSGHGSTDHHLRATRSAGRETGRQRKRWAKPRTQDCGTGALSAHRGAQM